MATLKRCPDCDDTGVIMTWDGIIICPCDCMDPDTEDPAYDQHQIDMAEDRPNWEY